MTLAEYGDFLALLWQLWATAMLFIWFEPLLEAADRLCVWAGVLGFHARVWALRAFFGVGFLDPRGRYLTFICGDMPPGRRRLMVNAMLMAGAAGVSVFESEEAQLRAMNGPSPESDEVLTRMGLQRITPAGATGCATTSPR